MFTKLAGDDLGKSIVDNWKGSALREESTLHQIGPYIGKMKSSMAMTLVSTFTLEGETVYDPFCGSGTVAFEAWATGRNVIANDLSPYAVVLTRAKLFPWVSEEETIAEINIVDRQVRNLAPRVDLRTIPKWVRAFFHPETLRETVAWFQVLRSRRSYFLLSCLLGILHHQRPGFLSYPSSHTVPYLRQKKFPRDMYPELYQYRPVQERLKKKVIRALKRIPPLDFRLIRNCHMRNAAKFVPEQRVNVIITSPPYMRQLDYGRDNRLRLWFLGIPDWKSLDQTISPSESEFLRVFKSCLKLWHDVLTSGGLCILVLGDTYSRLYDMALPDAIAKIAIKEIKGYSMSWSYTESIPNIRRVRRGYSGSQTETILVLRKN
ncbi:DNA adenine methylase [Patescibacteria group bacterium]|nr:DNA adenine methylase [Patescibacteria group bacterium]